VALAAPFAAVAGLLIVAGALKLLAPSRVAAGGPAPGAALGPAGARLAGALELALGAVALIAPGRLVAALVAAAFAAFAAYSLRLVVTGDAADCGCFGVEEGPVGMGHVALDLACAAVAAAAVVAAPSSMASVVADAPLTGVVATAGVATAVYAIYLAYTTVPRAWRAYEGGARG
jgi:hypothetical protein